MGRVLLLRIEIFLIGSPPTAAAAKSAGVEVLPVFLWLAMPLLLVFGTLIVLIAVVAAVSAGRRVVRLISCIASGDEGRHHAATANALVGVGRTSGQA